MGSLNTEWNVSWNTDRLKTLSAFANMDGGVMIIGKDDKGRVIGVSNPRNLLKIIPEIIKKNLGISPSVEAMVEDGKTCITITIEKEGRRISYDGVFYKRTGSCTQRVTGEELKAWTLPEMST
jgi:ATP-dependent DNA helicase RecG